MTSVLVVHIILTPTQPVGKAGHQLDKRSISAISDAYFDTSWRGDISWYLDYD